MKNWTYALLLLLAACGQKRQSPTDAAATRLCNCFSFKTEGGVEDKLAPCYQRVLAEKQKELLASTFTNQDSIQTKLGAFGLDLMVSLTRSCEKYFKEVSYLYDNSYPLDSSAGNKSQITLLTARIESETNQDSIKALLLVKVQRQLRARQYTRALKDIERIDSIDSNDYRVRLVKGFLFNQTGMHDEAIEEIEKAVQLSGNPNMILYAEIVKRKKEVGVDR